MLLLPFFIPPVHGKLLDFSDFGNYGIRFYWTGHNAPNFLRVKAY
jgi:hypothetical protein